MNCDDGCPETSIVMPQRQALKGAEKKVVSYLFIFEFYAENTTMKNKTVLLFCMLTVMAMAMQKPVPGTLSLQRLEQAIGHDYERQWRAVDSLGQRGLPQSALKILDQIYLQAKKENNAPQLVKAIIHQLKYQDMREEDSFVKAIKKITKETEAARPPLKNVLHSAMAEMYWWYYNRHRWQIVERSKISGLEIEDIEAWDLSRLTTEIDIHYQASLKEKKLLQDTDVSSFKAVIIAGQNGRSLRPSLYDFLAQRALGFYMNGEAGLSQSIERFVIDRPVYGAPLAQFLDFTFPTAGESAYHFKALKILQELLHLHINRDTIALVEVDLQRLDFVYREGQFNEKEKQYVNALTHLNEKYGSHPSSSEVLFRFAQYHAQLGDTYMPNTAPEHKWDRKKAVSYCKQALTLFPNAYGSAQCQQLMNQLQQSSFQFTLEKITPPKERYKGLLSFTNIDKLFYRLIRFLPEMTVVTKGMSRQELLAYYLKQPRLKEGSYVLKNDGDLQTHSTELMFEPMGFGEYIVLTSNIAFSAAQTGIINHCSFTVSNFSFLARAGNAGQQIIQVANRTSGAPLSNVELTLFSTKYDYRSRSNNETEVGKAITDKNGKAVVGNLQPGERYSYELRKGDDRLKSEHPLYLNQGHTPSKLRTLHTHFLTDRSIYRPGQAVHFKGIVIAHQDTLRELAINQSQPISFFDPNGQKISTLALTSNHFGTFSGSFMLPNGGLNGTFRIEGPNGSHNIQVEEYKRPKFEVTFQPLKGSYKLGTDIQLNGEATAYSGAPVDGAMVNYRIVRSAQYYHPYYDYHRSFMPSSSELAIDHGKIETNDQGQFTIVFLATGDHVAKSDRQLQYTFEIFVDVTDKNGETQSNQSRVTVGQQSLLLSATIDDKIDLQKTTEIELTTTNLNGEFEPTKGVVSISKLQTPDRVYRNRLWGKPDLQTISAADFRISFPHDAYENENEFDNWKVERKILSQAFHTGETKKVPLNSIETWEDGVYLMELEATDAFGEIVRWKKYITGFSTTGNTVPANELNWFVPLKSAGEPGEDAVFLIGSASNIKVLFEIEYHRQIVQSRWIDLNKTQQRIEIPIEEKHRGNFAYHLTFVKYGRLFQHHQTVTVPYTNKHLNIKLETFRDHLTPGNKEHWRFKITDNHSKQAEAEMLASMYDASLDAFLPHKWMFSVFPTYPPHNWWNSAQSFALSNGYVLSTPPYPSGMPYHRSYDQFNWFQYQYHAYSRRYSMRGSRAPGVMGIMAEEMEMVADEDGMNAKTMAAFGNTNETNFVKEETPSSEKPLLTPRSNFNETAFFYPHLTTNENGEVLIEFTLPESLTRWKLQTFAHNKQLQYGLFSEEFVAQKELMVSSNPPRFVREGDTMVLSSKLVNLTDSALTGAIKITFFDAITNKNITKELLGQAAHQQTYQLAANKSISASWRASIPETVSAILYRVQATSKTFADGEEHLLPVLSNRMLVTESLPLPMRGTGSKSFRFEKLKQAGQSSTLRHERLTLEFTANPAWYAVQALPYLMEYPHECAEQLFSRFYANALGASICKAQPKIQSVFEQWKAKDADALVSNLEKNQELKALLLEETPWLMQAKDESERKRRVALLFDLNKMGNEQYTALKKLQEMQGPQGGWPWFKGMKENPYITQYIVSGLGHLQHLNALQMDENPALMQMIENAIGYIDQKMHEDYLWLKNHNKNLQDNHLTQNKVQYLYARSFTYGQYSFPLREEHREAYQYYKRQAAKYWVSQNHYLQGMIALILHRYALQNDAKSDASESKAILASLKETSIESNEFGMYWKKENGYSWFQAPVERQALLIETFHEVLEDKNAVAAMQMWLLKQKQTQDWKTTKATAEACYALLISDSHLLDDTETLTIKVGSETIDPKNNIDIEREAGTGYFKKTWDSKKIDPKMGDVTVSRTPIDTSSTVEKISWGALYWQYFEKLDNITPHETPLRLSKQLFLHRNTTSGVVIEPISETASIKIGDLLKVRVELRVDRDMEYVHMKDMRASGVEPTSVLSTFRYQDGLGYYETTKDAATHFFFDYLPKGTYVFEYDLRANIAGTFSNGVTQIQSMYAPEFSSHSEGARISIVP
jgi:uncharacterized protein YfaS (alpha-2-macroglobulin family)